MATHLDPRIPAVRDRPRALPVAAPPTASAQLATSAPAVAAEPKLPLFRGD
jgi:hypothetical protein